MKHDELLAFASHGADIQLGIIQTELDKIGRLFPDKFPGGVPKLAQTQKRQIKKAPKKAPRKRAVKNDRITLTEAAGVLGLSKAGVGYLVRTSKIKVVDHKAPHKAARVNLSDVLELKKQRTK